MTKLEPGQRGAGRTRKRWFFLALAVGSALAVLVVGTLFGVVGDDDSAPTVVPPTVHVTPRPPAPVVAAPPVSAPPVVRAPPASSGDDMSEPLEATTRSRDGRTIVASPDGTTTAAPAN